MGGQSIMFFPNTIIIVIPSEVRFPLEVPFELAWLPKFRKCRSRLPEHLKRADFVLAVL